MTGFNWQCQYCNHYQIVGSENYAELGQHIYISDSKFGKIGYTCAFITCANIKCSEMTIMFFLNKQKIIDGNWKDTEDLSLITEMIRPKGISKNQPDYIPAALREDYREACLIKDLSPKSAATLARRCLQGMIRDFAKINRRTLNQEIIDLRLAVTDGTAPRDVSMESVDAIDSVRTVGNIGAHMEADVEHIIPVDPGEAQVLIELVESLFDEWYVERHKRTARFAAVSAMAAEKKAAIAAGKSPP